jgi:hypothetical protein
VKGKKRLIGKLFADHLFEMLNIHFFGYDQFPVFQVVIYKKSLGFEVPACIAHHFMHLQLVSFHAGKSEVKFFLYQFSCLQAGKKQYAHDPFHYAFIS